MMTTLRSRWSAFIDAQHRYPSGLAGRLIGERMGYQHAPETLWSLSLLDLRPSDRVLDIGCGAGHGIGRVLRQHPGQHIVGVDVSETMLRATARRNRSAVLRRRLSLLRGDIASLPFRTRCFDKIVSIHTFYFWPDPRALMYRLVSLLAPGGRLVAIFATAHTKSTNERVYWPLHEQARTLADELNGQPGISVAFLSGPESRRYNNIAIVVDAE